jgi:hypothetical protein
LKSGSLKLLEPSGPVQEIALPSTAEITQYALKRQLQRCSVVVLYIGYGLEVRKIVVQFPGRARDFFL